MFFLYVGYVQNIYFCYYVVDGVMQVSGDVFFIEYIEDVLWYGQCVWGDEVEVVVVEFGQCLGQGVDGMVIFQIVDYCYVEVFEVVLGFLNGEQVEQGLGWVLVSVVVGVQYWYVVGEFGCQVCGVFLWMMYYDGVDVGVDDGDGICQCFFFFVQ